jgi:hypothetical protein
MAWGAIGFGFKSRLVFFNGCVNSTTYVSSLADFINQANSTYGLRNWVFVQDGAPSHTAKATINTLCDQLILNPEWPANSPDLNPIEMAWAIMKSQMKWDDLDNIGQAQQRLINIWNSIPQDTIDRLVLSFPERVAMVRDAQGQTIQPLLSNGARFVPPDYLDDRPLFRNSILGAVMKKISLSNCSNQK